MSRGTLIVCTLTDKSHFLFTLFVFVCVEWCSTHIAWCFCFGCLCLVYHILPVSLDCSFLISPSVCSNVYFFRIHIWCTPLLEYLWNSIMAADRIDVNYFGIMFGEAFGRPSNITLFVRTIIQLRYLVVTKDAILHLWLKS